MQNQQNIKMGLKKQEYLKQQGQYNMAMNNMSPRKQNSGLTDRGKTLLLYI